MIPMVIICIPFISNILPGYTCFVPNEKLLKFLSTLLFFLMMAVLCMNSVDNDGMRLAYFHMLFFVCGTILFLLLGFFGERKNNIRMMIFCLYLWCMIYLLYLITCIVSVWNEKMLNLFSINDRCPHTLWLLDWCHNAVKYQANLQRNHSETNNTRRYLLDEEFQHNLLHIPANFTSYNQSFENLPRAKRSITEIGEDRYPSGPEYRMFVAYTLGVLFFFLHIIGIYTLYGSVIDDIIRCHRCVPPLIIVSEEALPTGEDESKGPSSILKSQPKNTEEQK